MKNISLTIVLILLLFGCNKSEEITFDRDMVVGVWELEQIKYSQVGGMEIIKHIGGNTILGIDENDSYFRNYISGEWTMNVDKLILEPIDYLSEFFREFEILELSENVLNMQLLEGEDQNCCNGLGFDENKEIIIIEEYLRSE